jgi:hypothetical protein
MKNLYRYLLLLLGLVTTPARAQLSGSDSLQAKLSSIFANIDKSQVPTGYLYEAVVRLLEPRFYNGLLTDSNRTDMDLLRYLRLQLCSAYVAGTGPLPTLPDYNARLDGGRCGPADKPAAYAVQHYSPRRAAKQPAARAKRAGVRHAWPAAKLLPVSGFVRGRASTVFFAHQHGFVCVAAQPLPHQFWRTYVRAAS